MADDVVRQLQSPDPNERIKAISALGRLKNKSVLPALAAVYRNDPDPDVRQLALKVGRFIQQESLTTSPIRGTVTEPDFLPDTSPFDVALHEQPFAPVRRYWQVEGQRLRQLLKLAAFLMLLGTILFILLLLFRVVPF
jgi:HEAT repeat protein